MEDPMMLSEPGGLSLADALDLVKDKLEDVNNTGLKFKSKHISNRAGLFWFIEVFDGPKNIADAYVNKLTARVVMISK